MSPSRRILIAIVVLVGCVCAALPFRQKVINRRSGIDDRQSQLRWRENVTSLPAPVRNDKQPSLEDAQDSSGPSTSSPSANVASDRNESLGEERLLPKIHSAYRPLLEPSKPNAATELLQPQAPPPPSTSTRNIVTFGGKDGSPWRIIRHRIRDGDSLQSLAARYLGDPSRSGEIYERNRDLLPSEEVLPLNSLIEIYVPR